MVSGNFSQMVSVNINNSSKSTRLIGDYVFNSTAMACHGTSWTYFLGVFFDSLSSLAPWSPLAKSNPDSQGNV